MMRDDHDAGADHTAGADHKAGADHTAGADPDQPSVHDTAGARDLPQRLRRVWRDRVGDSERALLLSWGAFAGTFALTRTVTHVLRRLDSSSGGSGGLVVAGRHLHHYNLGILTLGVVGGIGVHGQEDSRRHPVTAAAYGAGTALVVDELALLLDLSDVYWANDGRTSVDVAVGLIGVGGLVLAAVPFWSGATREVLRTRRAS